MIYSNVTLDLIKRYFSCENKEKIEIVGEPECKGNINYKANLSNNTTLEIYSNSNIIVKGNNKDEVENILQKLNDNNKNVFIVYSFKNAIAKDEIKKCLENWNFKVEIMDEKANKGQLLLEKLEKSIEKSHYGLVLLSPDDKTLDENDTVKYSPRPNVMFEWGMLLGYLKGNKHRVSVINCNKDKVQIASDVLGIAYNVINDDSENFKEELFKEVIHLYD